jgi:hypothetical protein
VSAEVVEQRVMDPGKALLTAMRAVCWDHESDDQTGLVPPWQGEAHIITENPLAFIDASIEARLHNDREHP